MHTKRYRCLTPVLLGWLVSACAGGSGSSGFDISENLAIAQALDERRCVELDGLLICPANGVATPAASPTPTPTQMPPETPPTPTTTSPTTTPTAPPAIRTASPTPTILPAEPFSVEVDTGANGAPARDCSLDLAGACDFTFLFAPQGFPPSATFLAAVRTVQPDGPWEIVEPIAVGPSTSFSAPVTIAAGQPLPGTDVNAQLAILVFLEPPLSVPTLLDHLTDSGADFAFVTQEVTLRPVSGP